MSLLRFSESTTDYPFTLPSQGGSLLAIEFPNGHYEWVQLVFTGFRRQNISGIISKSTSIACCQVGPTVEAVDDVLDRLHNSKFGSGGWLKRQEAHVRCSHHSR